MVLLDDPELEGKRIEIGNAGAATIGELIGRGGEGYVHELEDFSRSNELDSSSRTVVKILKEDLRAGKEDKIEAMIKNKPDIQEVDAEDFPPIAWPTASVTTPSGEFLGFEMPYVDYENSVTIYEYADSDEYPQRDADLTEIYRTGLNLAAMVHNVHESNHAIGDFNHKNIRVKNGYIALLDCDSYHIRASSGEKYQGNTFEPRYAPPEELTDSIRGVQSGDNFCLGIHIFQILMQGCHPYVPSNDSWTPENADNIEQWIKHPEFSFPYLDDQDDIKAPPALKERYEDFPKEIKELFELCFSNTSKIAGMGRPSPLKWIDPLDDLVPGGLGDIKNPWKNDIPGKAQPGSTEDTQPGSTEGAQPGSTENPLSTSSNSVDDNDTNDEDDAPGDTTSPF